MPADTVTIDRAFVEMIVVELDGIAHFDSYSNSCNETRVQALIYGVTEQIEKAAFGPMSEEESDRIYRLGVERGNEIARAEFAPLFEREEVASAS